MEHKEVIKTCSKLADKILSKLAEFGLPLREKWQIILDLDNVNNICPLNFDLLMSSDETLMHDYAGICKCFNRETLKFDDEYFVPRSAIKR